MSSCTARTDGHVGADIEAVCRGAATAAVREHVAATADEAGPVEGIELTADLFEQAFEEVEPRSDDGTTVGPAARADAGGRSRDDPGAGVG